MCTAKGGQGRHQLGCGRARTPTVPHALRRLPPQTRSLVQLASVARHRKPRRPPASGFPFSDAQRPNATASGVVDEYFVYKATGYASGGRCQVVSTHADTLLAVYASCGRHGALDPLGFANSESGRHADVTFDCLAGTSYFIFWNAEYMPGRHSFLVKESCTGYSCTRAHRSRSMVRRFKQRRTN